MYTQSPKISYILATLLIHITFFFTAKKGEDYGFVRVKATIRTIRGAVAPSFVPSTSLCLCTRRVEREREREKTSGQSRVHSNKREDDDACACTCVYVSLDIARSSLPTRSSRSFSSVISLPLCLLLVSLSTLFF